MLKKIKRIYSEDGLSSTIKRIVQKIQRVSNSNKEELKARFIGSYSEFNSTSDSYLVNHLDKSLINDYKIEHCIPLEVAHNYLNHRFDLLGSGWVRIYYGMQCSGLEGYQFDVKNSQLDIDQAGTWLKGRINKSNFPVSKEVWKRIDADYKPIDWQLDFKSGYRWSENRRSTNLKYGHKLGVDVKVPWELARMQHLPQMALRAGILGSSSEESKLLVRDIRNQMLDFIATNPPGFGVNWICSMDVAIRAANWCLCWDILQKFNIVLKPADEAILSSSLRDHGRHIQNHLEWSSDRANHYLANICGLIFIAAYLPEQKETDLWLAFCIGQLQYETLRQFLSDGGNFEGSTAYHRLSAEMVLYATAVIFGLSKKRLERLQSMDPKLYSFLPWGERKLQRWFLHENGTSEHKNNHPTPFSNDFIEKVQQLVLFFESILRADKTFPQIGDNDSSRFFKLQPIFKKISVSMAKERFLNLRHYEKNNSENYWVENHLNGEHLLDTADALGILKSNNKLHSRFNRLVAVELSKGVVFPPAKQNLFFEPKEDKATIEERVKILKSKKDGKLITKKFEIDLNNTIEFFRYPFFGLHIWRSKNFFLSIRAIESKPIKNMGHFHDDQLSVDLTINGKACIVDPGTYVYSPLPNERNRYRSRNAHFPTFIGTEKELDIFKGPKLNPVNVQYSGLLGFSGSYQTKIGTDVLVMMIEYNNLTLMFYSTKSNYINADNFTYKKIYPSVGYGIKQIVNEK